MSGALWVTAAIVCVAIFAKADGEPPRVARVLYENCTQRCSNHGSCGDETSTQSPPILDAVIVIPCDPGRGCDYINVVSFSPDGRTLAVGDENNVVRIFGVVDPATPVLKLTLAPPSDDYILSLAWSPDGQHLAVGDDDYYLTVYQNSSSDWSSASQVLHETPLPGCSEVVSATPTRTEIDHPRDAGCFRLHDVEFSPDGTMLAVGAGGTRNRCDDLPDDPPVCTANKSVVFIYTVVDWAVVQTLDPPTDDYMTSVAWSPDGATLVAVDEDSALTAWRVGTWDQITSVAACSGDCENVAFAPNGAFVAIAGGHGNVTVHTTSDWQQVANVQVTNYDWMSGGMVGGLAISPDSLGILVGTDTHNRTRTQPCFQGSCTDYYQAARNHVALVAELGVAEGGVPQGWRFKIGGADRDYNTVDYHPTGSYFAAGNDNGSVYLIGLNATSTTTSDPTTFTCECDEGWEGATCAREVAAAGPAVPAGDDGETALLSPAAIAGVIAGGVVLAVVLIVIAVRKKRTGTKERREAAAEEMEVAAKNPGPWGSPGSQTSELTGKHPTAAVMLNDPCRLFPDSS
jgi:WD40 repeat protein